MNRNSLKYLYFVFNSFSSNNSFIDVEREQKEEMWRKWFAVLFSYALPKMNLKNREVPYYVPNQVLGQKFSSNRDQGCDNVLPVEDYRTPQGPVRDK
jgi:hypothetical protein